MCFCSSCKLDYSEGNNSIRCNFICLHTNLRNLLWAIALSAETTTKTKCYENSIHIPIFVLFFVLSVTQNSSLIFLLNLFQIKKKTHKKCYSFKITLILFILIECISHDTATQNWQTLNENVSRIGECCVCGVVVAAAVRIKMS